MTRQALLWAVAALLGLAMTAALTWSVSRLTRERIGLSSEPSSVLNGLAPPAAAPPRRAGGTGASRGGGGRPSSSSRTPWPTVATPSPAPTPAAPLSPHHSAGENRDDSGGGSGGPDD